MIFSVFLNFYTHSLPGLPSLITVFDLLFLPIAFTYIIKIFPKIGIDQKHFSIQLHLILLLLLIMITSLPVYIYFNSKLSLKNLEDFATLLYSLFIFSVYSSYFNGDPNRIRKAFIFWYLGAVLAGVFSLITIFGLAPSHWRLGVRISGSFKAINQLQSFVAPALIISTFYLIESRKFLHRFIHILSIFLLVIALLATGSRSSIINILIAIIFANHIMTLRFPKISANFLIFLLFEIFVIINLIYLIVSILNGSQIQIFDLDLTNIFRIVDKMQEVVDGGDLGPRGEQWAYVANNFAYYPLGIGHGNFQAVVGLKNEVHNTFLGILIENGWIVFLGFAFLYLIFPISALTIIKKDRKIALFLIYVHLEMVAYQMTVYGFRQRIFWIELALIYSAILFLKWKDNAKVV